MPAFRLSHSDESQVDPFNAGEPELPADEPERLDEPPETSDARPDYAPHADPGGSPHKSDDNYQAPTTRERAYDAPSTDEPRRSRRTRAEKAHPTRTTRPARSASLTSEDAHPLGPEWQRAADEARRRAGRARGRRLGCMVALIVALSLFGSIGGLVASYVPSARRAISDGIDTVLEGDPSEDPAPDDGPAWSGDEQDLAAEKALEERLDVLLANPSSGELHDRVASHLSGWLLQREGYTAEELGIDVNACATWLVSSASYEISSVYTYDDGTGSAYFDMTALPAHDLLSTSEITPYLLDHNLYYIGSEDEPGTLTDAQRAEVAALWDEAAEGVEPRDSFLHVELTLEDGAWIVDEASLWSALESGFGIY